MGRLIGSVVLGYVVIFAAVFILMSGAWFAVGADRALQPGTWDISGLWVGISIVVGLVAGVAAGYVCAVVARDPRGPLWLIGLVVVLGVVLAVMMGGKEVAAGPRPDDVTLFEAVSNSIQPVWMAYLNPVLGAVGVFVGARLRGAPDA